MARNDTFNGRIINRAYEMGAEGYVTREIIAGVYGFYKGAETAARCCVDAERYDASAGKGGDCECARRNGVCKHAYALGNLIADQERAQNETLLADKQARAYADAQSRRAARNAPALNRAA